MDYRSGLPQLGRKLFLTDGGIETTLIFHRGLDLPEFAAFDLLKDEEGTEELRRYFVPYLELARSTAPASCSRAPPGARVRAGGPRSATAGGARRDEPQGDRPDGRAPRPVPGRVSPIVISGCIGPQDDGYGPERRLSADEAAEYHSTQIGTFADTEADMVAALTLTYVDEAIGIARAAQAVGIPVAISFTLETDGALPSGEPLPRRSRRRTPRPAADPPTT